MGFVGLSEADRQHPATDIQATGIERVGLFSPGLQTLPIFKPL